MQGTLVLPEKCLGRRGAGEPPFWEAATGPRVSGSGLGLHFFQLFSNRMPRIPWRTCGNTGCSSSSLKVLILETEFFVEPENLQFLGVSR